MVFNASTQIWFSYQRNKPEILSHESKESQRNMTLQGIMSQEFEGTRGHWDCSCYEMQVSYLFVQHPACERISLLSPLLSGMIYPLHGGCIEEATRYSHLSLLGTSDYRP